MQITILHEKIDELQVEYGDSRLRAIYGAGNTNSPKYCFVFMNPTGRNISAYNSWNGLRAPWIGTRNVWILFAQLGLISKNIFESIMQLTPNAWTVDFAKTVYTQLSENSVYVTNLAKCTQLDARPLKNSVFLAYKEIFFQEMVTVRPHHIVSLGNQVSSIILGKQVSVSKYESNMHEDLIVGEQEFRVYPTYYPVGQGRRNLSLAVGRIAAI